MCRHAPRPGEWVFEPKLTSTPPESWASFGSPSWASYLALTLYPRDEIDRISLTPPGLGPWPFNSQCQRKVYVEGL